MKRPMILLGGGGHAAVLWDILRQTGVNLLGVVAPGPPASLALAGLAWLGDDDAVAHYPPSQVSLVNGVGSVAETTARHAVFERFTADGYEFVSVIHPSAGVSTLEHTAGAGLQVTAGAVIGPHTRLGDNVLINTRAVVEHDCVVGDHCHVASGAVLCGACHLAHAIHVGAGAIVKQGVRVGEHATIAAGAVVVNPVEPYALVAGVPAVRKRRVRP
ncbi:putative UDP-N-acetylbacillosamine N-acetyltransferase [Gammaproteobacteria bacterium]